VFQALLLPESMMFFFQEIVDSRVFFVGFLVFVAAWIVSFAVFNYKNKNQRELF